jgi:chromosome segregation ATPase
MKTHRLPLRGALLLLLVPALFALGGCSLFGIATKGNLEDLRVEQEARDQRTATQLAEISQDLNAVESRLSDSMAQLDQDVDQMRETILTAQLALQSINVEMDALAASVGVASQNSQMALDLQKETLVAERNRLRLRLQQLDDQIASWQQTLPASQPTTRELRPSIVPEQQKTLTSREPEKPKTGDETSIWNRQR